MDYDLCKENEKYIPILQQQLSVSEDEKMNLNAQLEVTCTQNSLLNKKVANADLQAKNSNEMALKSERKSTLWKIVAIVAVTAGGTIAIAK